jgi:hypothetical protein
MATVSWDRKGVLMVEFMRQGTTITSKLHRAIQNKGCGMLTSGTVLYRDNSRSHTAVCTRALLEHELYDHPPFSPDFAQSLYRLFTYVKNCLRSQLFNNKE